MAGTHSFNPQEIAQLRIAESQADVPAAGAVVSKRPIDASEYAVHSQSRARGDIRNQAGLVAVFGAGRSGVHLHVLDRAGGKLRGEHLALLIADRLAIDHVGGLEMVAEGMEESVAV